MTPTTNQLQALLALAKHPLIPFVDLWLTEDGLSKVVIKSVIDADFSEVDAAIKSILGEAFPSLEYYGSTAKYYSPADETDNELYVLCFEGEVLIDVLMRKTSKPMTIEEILKREG